MLPILMETFSFAKEMKYFLSLLLLLLLPTVNQHKKNTKNVVIGNLE